MSNFTYSIVLNETGKIAKRAYLKILGIQIALSMISFFVSSAGFLFEGVTFLLSSMIPIIVTALIIPVLYFLSVRIIYKDYVDKTSYSGIKRFIAFFIFYILLCGIVALFYSLIIKFSYGFSLTSAIFSSLIFSLILFLLLVSISFAAIEIIMVGKTVIDGVIDSWILTAKKKLKIFSYYIILGISLAIPAFLVSAILGVIVGSSFSSSSPSDPDIALSMLSGGFTLGSVFSIICFLAFPIFICFHCSLYYNLKKSGQT